MWLLALILLLGGSSYWWIPLLFSGNRERHGCGCFTFIVGAIVGALIIVGYLSRGGMTW